MLSISILAVGRLTDRHLQALCQDYRRRLRGRCKLQIDEVRSARGTDPNETMRREAESLRRLIERGGGRRFDRTIALDRTGDQLTSPELARWLEKQALTGNSRLCFLIGGAHGLHTPLLEGADLTLSLSAMTFPHQLARLILLEQIYRAFTIWRGEPYHK
jgi:23S rRNA (pseudouridine1915-N3)-methyltransferase